MGEVVAAHSIQSERLTLKLAHAFRAIDSAWLAGRVTQRREAKRGVVLSLADGGSLDCASALSWPTGRDAQHPEGVVVDAEAWQSRALSSPRERTTAARCFAHSTHASEHLLGWLPQRAGGPACVPPSASR